MNRPTALDTHRPQIDEQLKSRIGDDKSLLPQMLRYHLGWTDSSGLPLTGPLPDRLHGVLCTLAAEAAGAPLQAVIPAAASVELLWSAYVVHRDLREGHPGRIDQPSLWWAWGHSQGINAGDALYAQARLALMDRLISGSPPAMIVDACRSLDQGYLSLSTAQCTLLALQDQDGAKPEDYVQAVRETEGAIASTAAALCAMVASPEESVRESLTTFGENLGTAWCLRAELQDYSVNAIGDRRAAVIENIDKRRTLPILYAFASTTEANRRSLERVGARSTLVNDDDVDAAISEIRDSGANDYVEDLILKLVAEGEVALDQMPLHSEKTAQLKDLGRYFSQPQTVH